MSVISLSHSLLNWAIIAIETSERDVINPVILGQGCIISGVCIVESITRGVCIVESITALKRFHTREMMRILLQCLYTTGSVIPQGPGRNMAIPRGQG